MVIFDTIYNLTEVVNHATTVHDGAIGQKWLSFSHIGTTPYQATLLSNLLQEIIFRLLAKLIADVFGYLP